MKEKVAVHTKRFSFFILIYLILGGLNLCAQTSVAESDSLIIAGFYKSYYGNSWEKKTNWLSGPVSEWYGVSIKNSRVSEICLPDNNIMGNFPEILTQLDALEVLVLDNNFLNGELPSSLYNMENLRVLSLSCNNFSGNLSYSVRYLDKLEVLNLENNWFEGPVPESISQCQNLEYLVLGNNQFSGKIPEAIVLLVQLESISLEYNRFAYTIPENLKQPGHLEIIDFYGNDLFYNYQNLFDDWSSPLYLNLSGMNAQGTDSLTLDMDPIILILSNSGLSGHLSENFFSNKSNLLYLDVSENDISGKLTPGLDGMDHLQTCYLNRNNLSQFPSFPLNHPLKRLKLDHNCFDFGSMEAYINRNMEVFTYANQDSLGFFFDTLVTENEAFVYHPGIKGQFNSYQWYHDDAPLAVQRRDSLVLNSVAPYNEGYYSCKIENEWFPGMELNLKKFYVSVINTKVKTDRKSEACRVFPNPSEGMLNLVIPGEQAVFTVDIYNSQGRLMKTVPNCISPVVRLNLELPQGIYFLRVNDEYFLPQTIIIK